MGRLCEWTERDGRGERLVDRTVAAVRRTEVAAVRRWAEAAERRAEVAEANQK